MLARTKTGTASLRREEGLVEWQTYPTSKADEEALEGDWCFYSSLLEPDICHGEPACRSFGRCMHVPTHDDDVTTKCTIARNYG